MIRTEQEYRAALGRIREGKEFLDQQEAAFDQMGLTPEETDRGMQPMRSFHAQLADEISWYENVVRGHFTPARRLTDLGRLLIASRISKGWTQKQLADALEVKESQVSRDERNEYHGITIERAQRILDALGMSSTTTVEAIEVAHTVTPAVSGNSLR